MTGVWMQDGDVAVRHDLPAPSRGAEEALVRVDLAGICRTDHELLAGYTAFRGVPGHEFVGTVVAGPADLVGTRVVADINVGCGDCPLCATAGPGHCPRRTVLGIRGRDGAFAERLALPVANLHVVPDRVPDRIAVFAEPLAAALRVRDQLAKLEPSTILVVGAGRLGQLVGRVLVRAGGDVSVVGHHRRKLSLLRGQGLHVLDAEETTGAGFDAVVECSGRPAGFALARAAVRPRGTLVLKSTYAARAAPVDLTGVVVDEIRLLGSRCGRVHAALRLLGAEDLGLEELVEARYPLADAVEAFAHSARPGTLKVLLAP